MYYKQNFNIQNWKHIIIAISVLVVSIVTFAFLVFSFAPSDILAVQSYPLQTTEVSAQHEWIPELPVRLIIPAIGVDAKIQHVGLDQSGSGEMEVPSNFTDVGWYQHGVRPGMRGSAVIAGHFNGKEVSEAVFYDLRTLQVGDEVVIMSAERIEDIFHVVKIETYNYNAPTTDVFLSTDGIKRLNLITCGGEWLPEEGLYDKRTVVFTELSTDVE